MAAFKELGPRDHPQPGDLNPQAEGEMCGGGTQRDLGINPDEILAKMVSQALGKDRLRANTYTGVVIRSNMQVTAISPELGPYFKVYKEIEEKEELDILRRFLVILVISYSTVLYYLKLCI